MSKKPEYEGPIPKFRIGQKVWIASHRDINYCGEEKICPTCNHIDYQAVPSVAVPVYVGEVYAIVAHCYAKDSQTSFIMYEIEVSEEYKKHDTWHHDWSVMKREPDLFASLKLAQKEADRLTQEDKEKTRKHNRNTRDRERRRAAKFIREQERKKACRAK